MNDMPISRLTITDRRELCINNVERVLGFDNDYVLIEAKEGKLTIEGSDLAIESLDKESGEIEIKGKITAVILSDAKSVKAGILSRIFK